MLTSGWTITINFTGGLSWTKDGGTDTVLTFFMKHWLERTDDVIFAGIDSRSLNVLTGESNASLVEDGGLLFR